MEEKIGECLIRLEQLSFEQAEEILRVQGNQPNKKFGEIALELGYITPNELDEAVAK